MPAFRLKRGAQAPEAADAGIGADGVEAFTPSDDGSGAAMGVGAIVDAAGAVAAAGSVAADAAAVALAPESIAGATVAGAAIDAAGAEIEAGAAWPPAALVAVVIGSSGTISSATMLMILISGLIAGPAVSL